MNATGSQHRNRSRLCPLLLAALVTTSSWAGTGPMVQDRLDVDVARGLPVVVHVVVALCDNANQGIVPVPKSLGNGQDPNTNLYWGALYGVRTHLPRAAGWARVDTERPENEHILDRVVFHASLKRDGKSVPVYVVADAWDGAHIRGTLQVYFRMLAGRSTENIEVIHNSDQIDLRAGGSAHLVACVGHNGLLDLSLEAAVSPVAKAPARSTIVLACASKSFFLDHLHTAGAHPLLLTTGLMAPEAYTLDSAIRSWVEERTTAAVALAAAGAYDRYQKCGLSAARRLFWGAP